MIKAQKISHNLSPGKRDPHLHLAAGVLLQAVTDTGEGDENARDWLLSNAGMLYTVELGFDYREVRRFAQSPVKIDRRMRRKWNE